MRTSKLLFIFVVLAMSVQANAARLVYTSYQDHASNPLIPDNGERVYTLAVQILPTDQGGDGTTVIGVSLIMTGVSGVSPVQLPRNLSQGLAGVGTYQQTQDGLDAGLDPSSIAQARAADSFFYSSPTGQLTTEADDGPVQVVADPKLNAPGLSPNPYALMWLLSNSPNSSTNVTGSSMSITGQYGDPYREFGNPVTAASHIGPGVYPLAQIVLPVGGSIVFEAGQSIGIATGNGSFFNVLGGRVSSDPAGIGAFLSYDPNAYLTNTRAIVPIGAASAVPEPGTLTLVAIGLAALLTRKQRARGRNRLATFGVLCGVTIVGIAGSLPSPARAATLHAGDIVATVDMTYGADPAVLQIDPVTGDRTILSDATHGAGPLFVFDVTGTYQSSVTRVADGRLVVAARNGVFYVDPTTGDRSMLTSNFASDLVAVGDQFYAVNYVGLYRIDPVTGATNLLSFDGRGEYIWSWNGGLIDASYDFFNLAGQLLHHYDYLTIPPGAVQYSPIQVGGTRVADPPSYLIGIGRYQPPSEPFGPSIFVPISDAVHGAGPMFARVHSVSVVPEPSTIVLAVLGIIGLAICKLRM